MQKNYYVYIVASISRVLYIGITNDLIRRVYEHKQGIVAGFTKSYCVNRLVYFEETSDVRAAIEREKQLKGWKRERKIALLESVNPRWNDLYLDLTG
jgi:putative endonuclease